jgi:hypothetical protein
VQTSADETAVLTGDTLAELALNTNGRIRDCPPAYFMDAKRCAALPTAFQNLDTVADAECLCCEIANWRWSLQHPVHRLKWQVSLTMPDKPILHISRRHHGNVRGAA